MRIVENETREAFLGVKTQIELVRAFKQSVKSMQLSLDSIKAGYEVGTRTTIDIIDAESVEHHIVRVLAEEGEA